MAVRHSDALVKQLAVLLLGGRRVTALTGAGVSTESGIPDFRSPQDGLWHQADPRRLASISGLRADPQSFYAFWRWRFGRLAEAEPNSCHRVLAAMEAKGLLAAVITQNIDGLHRRSGSKRVLEVHGTYEQCHCLDCSADYPAPLLWQNLDRGQIPRCGLCGGLIKPRVVLFEEAMPPVFEEAVAEIQRSDRLLVLGSSLEVYPVAGLVPTSHARGAQIAIVNREPTPYDHLAAVVIHRQLGEVMAQLAEELSLPVR